MIRANVHEAHIVSSAPAESGATAAPGASAAPGMRMRNIVITVVLCLFMAGPALLYGASIAGVQLPTWFTAEDARWLSGAVKNVDVAGNLNVEGFASKDLQHAIEDTVGNHVPVKAHALLGNASLQRTGIAASNALFSWPCYPTHFGSTTLYLPASDALSPLPDAASEEASVGLRSFAAGIVDAAQRHQDVRFCVLMVPGHRTPAVSPAYDLSSNPLTASWCFSILEEALAGQDNVLALTQEYSSEDAYYDEYFRTDHHWKASGALSAYRLVEDALGLKATSAIGGERIPIENYRFFGSRTRTGLMMVSEDVFDTNSDFSQLQVKEPEGDPYPYNHDRFLDDAGNGRQYRFHDSYYDFLPNKTVFVNEGAPEDGPKALVVTDSFGGDIEPMLALSYRETHVAFDLASNGYWEKAASFEQLVGEREYRDVFIVASPTDMISLVDDAPGYF